MLEAGFILLAATLLVIILAGVFHAANKVFPETSKRNIFKIKVVLFFVAWLAYVSIMAINGFFLDPSFPPRIPVFVVFPCLGLIIWFFKSGRFKNIIRAFPLSALIYLQTFRIVVELLLFGLFMKHMLPWAATFEGYNFDIGIGITAPFIGFLVAKKRLYPWAIRLWNILGIVTLSAVVIILNEYAYHPHFFNETNTILGKGFGTFPFIFLASFFMPVALFAHICSLIKSSQVEMSKAIVR